MVSGGGGTLAGTTDADWRTSPVIYRTREVNVRSLWLYSVLFAMHPPWITSFFLISLFSATITSSSEGERKENDNSTASRTQREIYERERRLIPYMTYYITPSLTTRTNPEPRQNIFVPITSPRENIYQINTFPKIPITAVHNDNQQQVQIRPKPFVRIQNPSILPQAIQAGKEGIGIYPQIYTVGNQFPDPGVPRSTVRPQVQPQLIQPGTQTLRLIKVNPVTIEQKYNPPQLIKIIPIITKLSAGDRSPKSFDIPPQQYAYTRAKIQAIPTPQTFTDQQYYKESPVSHTENFQGNKIYSHNAPKEPQIRLIDSNLASDKNKYTLAKIFIGTTTPSPYTDIKYKVTDAAVPIVLSTPAPLGKEQLTPSVSDEQVYKDVQGYTGQQLNAVTGLTDGKYVAIPASRQQLYYTQKPNDGIKHESQDLINSQNVQLPKLKVPLEEKIRFVATVTPIPVTNNLESVPKDKNYDSVSSLLKETNKLPQNLTPHNIDAGIKTLALILERLQKQKDYQQNYKPSPLNSSTPEYSQVDDEENYQNPKKVHSFPEKSGTSTPGRPGIDYPVYSSIPQTNFDCSTQRYKGFFGDPDTNCQVWHYCDLNGGQASFLCPNGTIFSQVALTCDWWFNVKCASTSQLYVLNERLYKYILPFSPSFPEDFSGPVVDTYLEAKFKEMEAKSRKKGKSSPNSTTTQPETTTESSTEDVTETATEHQTLLEEV